jgi:exopolysaccharide biosynthesis polyprenyl glycosylphosphotransferase
MKKKLILFSAIIADIILINVAICLGFLSKFHGIPLASQVGIFIYFAPLITAIQLITLTIFQLYKLDQDRYPFDVLYNSVWAITIAWLFYFLILLASRTYLFPTANVSRGLLVHNWIWTILLISGWRILYYRIERNQGAFISRVAIIGMGRVGKEIMQELNTYSHYEHQVVGFIDAEIAFSFEKLELPVLGKITDLGKLIDQYNITEVIIAISGVTPAELLKIINQCHDGNTRIKILPSLYEVTVGRIALQETAGIPLIELRAQPISGIHLFLKRMIDLILSLCGLIIFLPIFIIVAMAIKLTSLGGPVLYRQQRVGKGGRLFMLYKFRTMVPNAEALTGPVLATEHDMRVTKVGMILRKTRLDELLQLFNVLKGDMSLVGPRPERPEFVTKFEKLEPFYERRHLVYPGVTGLAQIHGRYDSSVENKLRYDLAYVYNISLMLDLKILFSTLWVVLSGKGAR